MHEANHQKPDTSAVEASSSHEQNDEVAMSIESGVTAPLLPGLAAYGGKGKTPDLTPGNILALQRTLGNQAVMRMLADQKKRQNSSGKPALARSMVPGQPTKGNTPAPGEAKGADSKIPLPEKKVAEIQRAIGFEIEFGTWETAFSSGKRLPKGHKIVRKDGFAVEGEDADSEQSAIEIVTKPMPTKARAAEVLGHADTIMELLHSKKKPVSGKLIGGDDNIVITPGTEKAKIQASPSIGLDSIGGLYDEGTQNAKNLSKNIREFMSDEGNKNKYLGGETASKELEGFLTLVVDYLFQGCLAGRLGYPKSAFPVMARTSFTKMFSMMPEHAFFGKPENRDLWIEMVIDIAKKNPSMGTGTWQEIAAKPVMNMNLIAMENLPADKDQDQQTYKLNTTREDWLRNMPDNDKLSQSADKRFEGMGAYGNATDVGMVDAPPTQPKPQAPTEDVPSDKVPELEKVGEQVGEKMVSLINSHKDDPGEKEPEEQEAPVEKVDNEGEKPPTPTKVRKEAPLFELRGMADLFDIQTEISIGQFAAKSNEIFDLVDKANKGVQYEAQGGGVNMGHGGGVDSPGMWDKQAQPPTNAPVIQPPPTKTKKKWKQKWPFKLFT